MSRTTRGALWAVVALCSLSAAAVAGAHEPGAPVAGHDLGLDLGFGVVVALTVLGGVGGGVVVARRRAAATSPASRSFVLPVFLVVLGCWAAVVAVLRSPVLAAAVVGAGATGTWALQGRLVVGHRGCDGAALGAVLAHRFVEGALLATLYSAAATVGVGVALALAAHTAAETGAVAGLWSPGRWTWAAVALVQAGFVAGALGGAVVAPLVTPLAAAAVLALLGGALIAAGVVTASGRRRPAPA